MLLLLFLLLGGKYVEKTFIPSEWQPWFGMLLSVLGAIVSSFCGYTWSGTMMGYRRTTTHLERREGETDATFAKDIQRWYCYKIGYRLAMEDAGLTPLF